jgi:small subunit ribosomal protein S6
MRKYEIMLILPAEADDAVVTQATDRVAKVIMESGGEILSTSPWGRRRLAYEIDKHTEGFYVVADFTADPDIIKELDRVLSLADEVIRFKIVVREPQKARPPKAEAQEAEPQTAEPQKAETAEPASAEPQPEEAEAQGAADEATPASTPA